MGAVMPLLSAALNALIPLVFSRKYGEIAGNEMLRRGIIATGTNQGACPTELRS